MHPYQGLPDHHFWKRAVSAVEPFRLDPVTHPKFQISTTDRVSTAGSCFAQHLSQHLRKAGFSYFVPESGSHLPPNEQQALQYGTFSARYGNIYTVRQLRQLFEEAFHQKSPEVPFWTRADGRLADPRRPNVQPEGFPSLEALQADRQIHLSHVRTVFLESDVFVFTLGLTEVWRHRLSGEVYPLAPGVTAGDYDPALYEFANLSLEEIQNDLLWFLSALKEINPGVRVLLSVSPVPLIATYENRHVLVSNTLSKAVLRVAAQGAIEAFPWVDYFPSYELFAGSHHQGRYYAADLREAAPAGILHAMRLFGTHYLHGAAEGLSPSDIGFSLPEIVCDENAMERIRI